MQATENGLQHVNIKFFIRNPETIDLGDAIPVFHKWIQEDKLDDLLIDVADYRHVPEGPGVILVAHNAFHSLDHNQGRLGVLYNRRTAFEGGTREAVVDALERTRKTCQLLAGEARFQGRMEFDRGSFQFAVNDRHFAANTEKTLKELQPDLEAAFKQALGEANYTFRRAADPRSRLVLDVKSDREFQI